MIAHECPSCKWKLAYVGFTAVECANTKCAFYNERWYQECADAWMAGKFDWPGYGVRTPGVVTKLELELRPQPTATPEIWSPEPKKILGLADWVPEGDTGFFGLDRAVVESGRRWGKSALSLASFDALLKHYYKAEHVHAYVYRPNMSFVSPDTYNQLTTDIESLIDERDSS